MKILTNIIILILVSLLTSSIAYNIKQYKDLKNHHREIATSTMNVITTFHEASDKIEKEASVSVSDRNEITSLNKSFLAAFFSIGVSSIAEIYDELPDHQKEIVWEVRQYLFDQLYSEEK